MRHPIVLAQFPISSMWSAWVSYEAGLWYTIFTGVYPNVDDALDANIATLIFDVAVGAVQYHGVTLPETTSIGQALSTESFYWDKDARILYAHFPNFNPPDDSVRIGIQYSIGTEFLDGMDGTIFRPHLKNTPPLTQAKDRLFFKKVATATWTMTLDNAGRDYDDMANWGAYNQPVTYYLGEAGAPFSEFVPIRSGRIRDFTFSGNEVHLNIQDLRAKLTMKMPQHSLTIADYPNMDSKLSGKLKPMAFGKIYNVEPPCLNANDPTGPYVFMLADTAYAPLNALTTVRANGVEVTPTATDLDLGVFTLTAAQCKDGSSFLKVTADFEGYVVDSVLLENPVKIARTIMNWISGIAFTDDNFDTAEWAREELLKPNVGLYVAEPNQVLSVIGRLMEATRGGLLVTSDGRYTWRTPNYEFRAQYNVTDMDWRETPEISYDTTEVLAYTRVGYRKNESENSYRFVENRLSEDQVFNLFGITDGEEFEVVLANEADAEAYADEVMVLSATPAVIITGRIPIRFSAMKLGENVQLAVNRLVNNEFVPWLGTVRGELLSVAIDPLLGDMEISVRVVNGIPAYVESSGTVGAIYGLSVYGDSVYGEG